jgi:hypothetical protein
MLVREGAAVRIVEVAHVDILLLSAQDDRRRRHAEAAGAVPFRFRVSAVRDGAEAFQAGAAGLGREAFPP